MKAQQVGKSPFGLIGLFIGVLSFGGALAHFWLGPIDPPPPLETVIAEKAVKIKEAIGAKLKGKDLPQSGAADGWDADRIVNAATAMIGFAAIVFAIVSFIRREDLRISGSAATIGAGAIAFQFAVVAVGALLLVILIAAVLSTMGGGG